MIAGLKPYPAYKESGADWLGAIPREWEVRRLGWCVDINRRTLSEETSPDFEFDYLDISSVGTGHLNLRPERMNFASAPTRARRVVSQGDTLVSTVRTYLKATWCAGHLDGPLVCSTGFAVLSPRTPAPRFWGYVAQSEPFTRAVVAESVGVAYPAIDDECFRHLPTVLPPLEDQAAIVCFLDYLDSRIRRLSVERERLVKLLEEEKQAILHRAVTRGFDATAPLRDSRIEGLGEVPEGWEVRRLKFLGRIGTKLVDPRRPEFVDQTLIAPNHVQAAAGRLLRQETAGQQGAESGKYIVHEGELVYSKIRPALRKVVISPVEGLCSADMYPIAPRRSLVDPRFLLLAMLSEPFTRYVVDCSLRVAMPKVNREALGDARIAYPGLPDQREIVELMRRESAGPDEAIARAERQIALLREYRTRLISDVVTGKLDVREAAANLSDDPDADDPALDERLEEVAAG